MSSIIRLLIGSIVGAVATFFVGFIFWASPLSMIGYSTVDETQSAALQLSLAQNLTHTGRYIVPNPGSQAGTVLFGKGPIATVDFNTHGYAVNDTPTMIGGFIQEGVAMMLIGLSLLAVADRVVSFEERARLVIGFSAAAAVLIQLSDPIFNHGDWRFAIYATVADIAMLAAGGLVVARWFLPRGATR